MITIEELKRYEIFAEMDLTELKLLSAMAEERKAREGDELIRIGSPARTLYILQEGGLMVVFPDGRAITLHKPGRVVGWSALVSPTHYTASVTCLTDSILIAFPGSELLRLVQRNVAFGTKIMRKISEVLSRRLPFLQEKDKRILKQRS
ncbi:MAG: cyclic nucleotide-binding domain-containing protein [Deltaproteobacteria bacterium]|nr:MAG: cyclic nucleotide-binding domain-containing protein [Deltaproteobacteria bacterium]